MNEIVLVRHLPTPDNVRKVLQGNRDIPILVPGATANALRDDVPAGPYDLVLSSPLRRALQSAAFFGYPDPQVEELLREVDFGPYEGRSRDELMAPETGWVEDPFTSTLAKQVDELRARVERFFETYRRRGRVLAFAHGSWMRFAHARYHLGDARRMNRFMLENGAVLRFAGD